MPERSVCRVSEHFKLESEPLQPNRRALMLRQFRAAFATAGAPSRSMKVVSGIMLSSSQGRCGRIEMKTALMTTESDSWLTSGPRGSQHSFGQEEGGRRNSR